MLNLAVGDVVVYGAHGAGSVAARETRSLHGEQQTVVVIALAGGLSVQLPLALAREQLRPVVDDAGIATIERVLRDAPSSSSESWQKRQREAHAKLGDAIGLAEILRDIGAPEAPPAGRPPARLSPSEHALVRRARTLLATELALARHFSVADAEAWIDDQLAVTR